MLAGKDSEALVLLEGLKADGACVTGIPLGAVLSLGEPAYGPEGDSSVGPSVDPKSTLPKKGF